MVQKLVAQFCVVVCIQAAVDLLDHGHGRIIHLQHHLAHKLVVLSEAILQSVIENQQTHSMGCVRPVAERYHFLAFFGGVYFVVDVNLVAAVDDLSVDAVVHALQRAPVFKVEVVAAR